jgi:hypothetical protein
MHFQLQISICSAVPSIQLRAQRIHIFQAIRAGYTASQGSQRVPYVGVLTTAICHRDTVSLDVEDHVRPCGGKIVRQECIHISSRVAELHATVVAVVDVEVVALTPL